MFALREIRIFVKCAVAQLVNGNESLANGPLNSAIMLDARPQNGAAFLIYAAWELARVTRSWQRLA